MRGPSFHAQIVDGVRNASAAFEETGHASRRAVEAFEAFRRVVRPLRHPSRGARKAIRRQKAVSRRAA